MNYACNTCMAREWNKCARHLAIILCPSRTSADFWRTFTSHHMSLCWQECLLFASNNHMTHKRLQKSLMCLTAALTLLATTAITTWIVEEVSFKQILLFFFIIFERANLQCDSPAVTVRYTSKPLGPFTQQQSTHVLFLEVGTHMQGYMYSNVQC